MLNSRCNGFAHSNASRRSIIMGGAMKKVEFSERRAVWPTRIRESALKTPDQWKKVRVGKKVMPLMSIWDLYMEIVQNPALLDELLSLGLDAFLEKHGWVLYEDCYISVKKLLKKHEDKREIENLKAVFRETPWARLRVPGDPETFNSACPWMDCPP